QVEERGGSQAAARSASVLNAAARRLRGAANHGAADARSGTSASALARSVRGLRGSAPPRRGTPGRLRRRPAAASRGCGLGLRQELCLGKEAGQGPTSCSHHPSRVRTTLLATDRTNPPCNRLLQGGFLDRRDLVAVGERGS